MMKSKEKNHESWEKEKTGKWSQNNYNLINYFSGY